MADDETIEETKQTLVQRFRAWGGKFQSASDLTVQTVAGRSSIRASLTVCMKQKTHSHHPSWPH
jgi:hypothetical protein